MIQNLLLQYPTIASIAQPCVLFFECLFPIVLFQNYSPLLNAIGMALILFGIAFHIGCFVLFQIDFVHFWLPTYWAFMVYYCSNDGSSEYYMHSKILHNEEFIYHPLTVFMVIAFLIAHIRIHSGLNWPNSSFDLYNQKLTKNIVKYHAIQLIDINDKIIPFDMSICSSSGMTRSFGYHYCKMLKNNDLDEFLYTFLPRLLISEGYIARGKMLFKGLQVVELSNELDSSEDSRYTLYPAKLVKRHLWQNVIVKK